MLSLRADLALGIRCGGKAIAREATSLLENGTPLDRVVGTLLAALPESEHVPFSILQVNGGTRGNLVECDAPPLFMARGGELVILPSSKKSLAASDPPMRIHAGGWGSSGDGERGLYPHQGREPELGLARHRRLYPAPDRNSVRC